MNTRKSLTVDKEGVLCIGGANVTDLVNQYGTPLYVFDKEYIESMCKILVDSMKNEYGNGIISYASKAFSCKEIYRIIDNYGLWTDVVSIGEFYTAISTGFSSEKIIFHGNNKTFDDLKFAVSYNVGIIVIDSETEIDDLNEICKSLNKKVNVLLRVNPGVEAHTHHYIQTAKPDSKFGFSILSSETEDVIKKILSCDCLNFLGLHCHIGSQIFDIKSFLLAVQKMSDYYKHLKTRFGIEFKVLNLGGGFGIYYSENDKKFVLSDYYDFVKQISNSVKNTFSKNELSLPTLILEPGRSIVGEAGITLYTAGRIKRIKNVKNFIAVDGGMFDNPRYALYQARYSVECANKMLDEKNELFTIAGKCCESGDIIAENVKLPNVKEGDIIAVFSTGAYNYSMSSNYNGNLVPPVVMVKDGKSYFAVKKQTYEDLIRNNV